MYHLPQEMAMQEENLFVVVEELPEFPGGGRDAMSSWISKNLKYPADAAGKKVTGTVDVGFFGYSHREDQRCSGN